MPTTVDTVRSVNVPAPPYRSRLVSGAVGAGLKPLLRRVCATPTARSSAVAATRPR